MPALNLPLIVLQHKGRFSAISADAISNVIFFHGPEDQCKTAIMKRKLNVVWKLP